LIYIASPYSDPDPKIRQLRFEQVASFTGTKINKGLIVYSPIVHNHPIATYFSNLPKGFDFWQHFDLHILNLCDQLTVLCIDGWEESKGVQAEIRFARNKDMPVLFQDLDGEDIYKSKKKYSYTRRKRAR
jgi:hypothetical protein